MSSLLERKRRVLMPCLYHFFGDDPIEMVRGRGTSVWDSGGKEYLDFYSGVAVNSLGHCHPEVVAAAEEQLRRLQHTTTIYLTEPMIELAEKLVAKAPAGLSRVFFCADGSGANEGALVAARLATGRPDFLAFDLALHGRTSLTMSVTGLPMWRADPFSSATVHRVSAPIGKPVGQLIEELRRVIERAPESIAAMIAEPVLGNGGIIVPPEGYFQAVRSVLDEYGILLIADEVQTGFCRTGEWFGMQHWNVSPDLMTVAKALTNGLPAAAWIATEEVAQAFTRPAASTFGGNLVPMAAGLKVMEIMERDGLADRAGQLGTRMLDALKSFAAGEQLVGEVRGLGLMIGVELLDEDGEPGTVICDQVLGGMRERGVLAGKTGPGRNVVTFEPPLIVSEDEVDRVLNVFQESYADASRNVLC